MLFPASFRGELAQYISHCKEQGATYLFESNRLKPFSTWRIRQIIHQYASEAVVIPRRLSIVVELWNSTIPHRSQKEAVCEG